MFTRKLAVRFLAFTVAFLALSAEAATYTVTTTADSGAGSLRQAILDANASVGADTIAFAIGTGPQTIAPTSALPAITDQVTIDGTTQPGFSSTPLIELSGASAGAANGIWFAPGATNSTVQWVVVNGFAQTGIYVNASGVLVSHCRVGTNAAGNAAVPNGSGIWVSGVTGVSINANLASGQNAAGTTGVTLDGSTSCTVQQNNIGTDWTGTAAIPNSTGITVINGAAGNTIVGNVVSGNSLAGMDIAGPNTTVQGNSVGLNPGASAAVPNGGAGILLRSAGTGTIGGTAGSGRNYISGNLQAGIDIEGSSNWTIQGNFIGSNAAGTTAIANGGASIFIQGPTANNLIGGTAAGAANLVLGNPIGILSGTGNAILGNAMNLLSVVAGIDLGNDFTANPNDSCDADTGANDMQNHPVLTSVVSSGGVTTIQGTLDSAPNTSYRLEFFAASAASTTTYIGTATVALGGSCTGSFSTTAAVSLSASQNVYATATVMTGSGTGYGDTSELSAPFAATPVTLQGFAAE